MIKNKRWDPTILLEVDRELPAIGVLELKFLRCLTRSLGMVPTCISLLDLIRVVQVEPLARPGYTTVVVEENLPYRWISSASDRCREPR